MKRDGIPNHNCVKTLLEEKAVDKAIIAKQKAENKIFEDQAKYQKAAEEEQAAIIAKLKAENEILKAKAAKCKCEAFGKVK